MIDNNDITPKDSDFPRLNHSSTHTELFKYREIKSRIKLYEQGINEVKPPKKQRISNQGDLFRPVPKKLINTKIEIKEDQKVGIKEKKTEIKEIKAPIQKLENKEPQSNEKKENRIDIKKEESKNESKFARNKAELENKMKNNNPIFKKKEEWKKNEFKENLQKIASKEVKKEEHNEIKKEQICNKEIEKFNKKDTKVVNKKPEIEKPKKGIPIEIQKEQVNENKMVEERKEEKEEVRGKKKSFDFNESIRRLQQNRKNQGSLMKEKQNSFNLSKEETPIEEKKDFKKSPSPSKAQNRRLNSSPKQQRIIQINLKTNPDFKDSPISKPSNVSNESNWEILEYSEGIKPASLRKQTIPILEEEIFLKHIDIPESVLNDSFCEVFFITSFPKENGKIIENSEPFRSTCNHDKCSQTPAMQPEIIYRYPAKNTKKLEINNLAASICFPTGIKLCYDEGSNIETVKNYGSSITNQQGDRFYMMTYHFYYKIHISKFTQDYKMYPIKNITMKFGDNEIKEGNNITEILEIISEFNFRDTVLVPYCMCLISKYPYFYQMELCLDSIFQSLSNYNANIENISALIKYIVRSIPIPTEKTQVKWAIPFISEPIKIKCPMIRDINLLNDNYILCLLSLFSIENIITIFRLMIFEQKILFVDNEYDRLSKVTNSFISLLYPFQWIHTYIPIMSEQMLKYLQAFLPYLNGIHEGLFLSAKQLLEDAEEGVFIVYTHKNLIDINSNLKLKKFKIKKKLDEHMPNFPKEIEDKLNNGLKAIKSQYDKKPNSDQLIDLGIQMKNLFIEIFVGLAYDYMNYLTMIDDFPIFNSNALFQNRPSKDEEFYHEFTDTQLFQVFLQTMVKDKEHKIYFNHRIKQYLSYRQSKLNTDNPKNDYQREFNEMYEINTSYAIRPYFIEIDANASFYEIEEQLQKNHPKISKILNENGTLKENLRICGKLIPITSNQNNSTYQYFQIPGKTPNLVEEIKPKPNKIQQIANKIKSNSKIIMLRKSFCLKGDGEYLSDSEKEEIRDGIKEILTSALRSEEFCVEEKAKQLMNYVKYSYGRNYFINSIFQNEIPEKTIKPISPPAFDLFFKVIYEMLLQIIAGEEDDKSIENAITLIRTSQYYYKDEKKKVTFIFDQLKDKLNNYSLILKKRFWEKWLDNILNEEYSFDKEKYSDEQKVEIIKIGLNKIDEEMNNLKMKQDFIIMTIIYIAKDRIINEETFEEYKKERTKKLWERNFKNYKGGTLINNNQ